MEALNQGFGKEGIADGICRICYEHYQDDFNWFSNELDYWKQEAKEVIHG